MITFVNFLSFFLFFFGLAVLLVVFLHFLRSLYNILFPYYFLSPLNLKKKTGANWAVVTGATDGIGKAYSFELAQRGFHIFLISRTKSKLENTKTEIQNEFNVEVETFAFDFSTGNVADYEPLIEELKKKEIGVLINNVGGITDYPEILHKSEGGPKKSAEVLLINVLPPTILSAAILSQMSSRKAGIIVNIASAAGLNQMKEWSVYSAAKKYVRWLTAILQEEYEPFGIIIQSICPFLVATNLSKVTETSFFGPNAAAFTKMAIRTIGLTKETTGYITHQIQAEAIKILPKFIFDWVVAKRSKEMREQALLTMRE